MKYLILFIVGVACAMVLYSVGVMWYTSMIPGGLLWRSTPLQLLLHSLPTLAMFGIIGGLFVYLCKTTFSKTK